MLEVNQLIGFGVGGGNAIQFVGSNIASRAGSASTVTMPVTSGLTGGIASGASNGDLILAVFAVGGANGTDPSMDIDDGSVAYTAVGTDQRIADTNYANLYCAYKFMNGDTTVRFGDTGSTNYAGAHAVFVFRGVSPTSPLDVTVVEGSASNSNEPDPPVITPATPGAIIICVGACATTLTGTGTFTDGGDLTDFRTIGGSDTVDVCLGVGLKTNWSGGAFNAAAWTFSAGTSSSDSWASKSIALRPA